MTNVPHPARQSGKISAGCVWSIVIVAVLFVGGLVGGGYYLFQKGMGMVAEQAKVALRDDPVVKEHLGEIQEISVNLSATGAAPENQDKDDDAKDTVLVFDVTGSKGKGQITLWMDESQGEDKMFSKGRLRTEDGTTHDIVFEESPAPDSPAPEEPGPEEPAPDDPDKKDGPDDPDKPDPDKPDPDKKDG